MDAYDEDSPARREPDGSRGARRPRGGPEEGPGSGPIAGPRSGPESGPAHDPGSGPEPGPAHGPDPAAHGPEPDPAHGPEPGPEEGAGHPFPRTGLVLLSPRYQVGAAVALAVVAVAACVHLGMVFLSVAPSNTVTKQHGKAIEDWVYPEFEQNWKLFAPNPLQQNIAVQVRAEVRLEDGGLRTTGWDDLSAEDGAAIDGSPLPSHTEQNELRRAWDFFVATHDAGNRPVGTRGALSEQYVRRIALMRLDRDGTDGGTGLIQRVQVRSVTTGVQPPKWSGERISGKPVYRVLPWWTVPAGEAAGGVR
ncbi:DUF5819 family protein [Streptomyces sp. TG1A-8]|uniref:DUF5819 family protein n=1 Tax=Streptomyces sp. TG1A-8 TaxID=3051385 RepID=UPI00265BAD4C|nr:DUF5819 family protein [Streptomyces sp. TG1A-8]MDO0926767.1 DUF5819 family protein [Streptomyces sp. TG1A-8]